MTTAWRIVQPRWQATAFNGDGARLNGGRWNNVGTALVYTAGSLSLAQLEILVHAHKKRLLSQWVVCELGIPDDVIISVDMSRLPLDWDNPSGSAETQQIGDRWAHENVSVALRVPSAVSPPDFCYLLNPLHVDFHKITIGPFRPFTFDPRLAK